MLRVTHASCRSWNTTEDVSGDVDMSGWAFGGANEEEVRTSLRALLAEHGLKLSAVFKTLDTSDDNTLNEDELRRGFVERMGFSGAPTVFDQIWAALDRDGSGKVTFEELNNWLVGRHGQTQPGRVAAVRRLALPSADSAEWDTARLRRELQAALRAARLRVVDLLEVWDEDGSGFLRKKVMRAAVSIVDTRSQFLFSSTTDPCTLSAVLPVVRVDVCTARGSGVAGAVEAARRRGALLHARALVLVRARCRRGCVGGGRHTRHRQRHPVGL